MPVLLLIAALVIGYFVLKGRKVAAEPPAGDEAWKPSDIFPSVELNSDGFYAGQTLYHKETGEKVEILRLPAIWNGEATIRWADGHTGEIHHGSLKEFFE